MRRITLVVLLLLGLPGCSGPTLKEVLAARPADKDHVVRIWQSRLPSVLQPLAVHLTFELRTPETPPGEVGDTWEVWQNAGTSGSHVREGLHVVGHGVGGGDSTLLHELRGKAARKAIAWIQIHAPGYRHRERYLAWPGPNSNTFVADLIRDCPELSCVLPSTAIGKDWPGILALRRTTTGLGFDLDFLIIGASLGLTDGVQVRALGLAFGIQFWPPALLLPGVGRVGVPQYDLPDPPEEKAATPAPATSVGSD